MSKVATVIVARGDLADADDVNDWSRCTRCQHGVLIPEVAVAKVTAGTWRALCIVCALQLAEERPEVFGRQHHIWNIGRNS